MKHGSAGALILKVVDNVNYVLVGMEGAKQKYNHFHGKVERRLASNGEAENPRDQSLYPYETAAREVEEELMGIPSASFITSDFLKTSVPFEGDIHGGPHWLRLAPSTAEFDNFYVYTILLTGGGGGGEHEEQQEEFVREFSEKRRTVERALTVCSRDKRSLPAEFITTGVVDKRVTYDQLNEVAPLDRWRSLANNNDDDDDSMVELGSLGRTVSLGGKTLHRGSKFRFIEWVPVAQLLEGPRSCEYGLALSLKCLFAN